MENNILGDITNVKHSSKSLPEQVADKISHLIIEHRLQNGDKLPNEFELAEKFYFPSLRMAGTIQCVVCCFFQSKQQSYRNMFWYKDSTHPKHQVCYDCKLFFQILHKLSNYAGR